MKLADILWEAANKHLDSEVASCCAVYRAEKGETWYLHSASWDRAARSSKGVQFLKSLGCRVGANGFGKHPKGDHRQGVRYMWLLLAMHVAEDEGIEV